MKYTLLLGASALALGFGSWTTPAEAGNIILTGHDNDYHCSAGNYGNACGAISAELSYVRDGSSLPVLVIDNGNELSNSVSGLGIAFTAKTVNAVTAGMFNHATYSAFAVASVSSCGGCDNPIGSGTKLSSFSTAIASFVTAGGGVLGLAGATDPDAYAYVPDAAGNPTPIYSSSGFVATSTGTTAIPGFFAVNGDETHNQFSNPGTGGVSPAYKVAERFGGTTGSNPAITLFTAGAIITCKASSSCTIKTGGGGGKVPEPMTLGLLGVGLFGLGAARRARRS